MSSLDGGECDTGPAASILGKWGKLLVTGDFCIIQKGRQQIGKQFKGKNWNSFTVNSGISLRERKTEKSTESEVNTPEFQT